MMDNIYHGPDFDGDQEEVFELNNTGNNLQAIEKDYPQQYAQPDYEPEPEPEPEPDDIVGAIC